MNMPNASFVSVIRVTPLASAARSIGMLFMVATRGIGTCTAMGYMHTLSLLSAIAFGGIGASTLTVLAGASALVLLIMPAAIGAAGMAATGVAAGVAIGDITTTDIIPDGVAAVTIQVGVVEAGTATGCIPIVARRADQNTVTVLEGKREVRLEAKAHRPDELLEHVRRQVHARMIAATLSV